MWDAWNIIAAIKLADPEYVETLNTLTSGEKEFEQAYWRLGKDLVAMDLNKHDESLLKNILRDEIRWGIRGNIEWEGQNLIATFDAKGDAAKYRRLAIRAGFNAEAIYEVDRVDEKDYVVRITELR